MWARQAVRGLVPSMRLRRVRRHGTAPLPRCRRAGRCASPLHAEQVTARGRDPLCVCGNRRHAFEVLLLLLLLRRRACRHGLLCLHSVRICASALACIGFLDGCGEGVGLPSRWERHAYECHSQDTHPSACHCIAQCQRQGLYCGSLGELSVKGSVCPIRPPVGRNDSARTRVLKFKACRGLETLCAQLEHTIAQIATSWWALTPPCYMCQLKNLVVASLC